MTPTSVRGHFGMEMPSARDCLWASLLDTSAWSHVKLQYGLQLPKSDTGRRWERTGLVTFKVVMGGESLLLFNSHLIDFYKLFHLDGKIVGRI
ncbi:hypothetical protein EVAR_59916_1 [Eumeta japonica]|uniref:Uncharacterized protein n=1 Tax=Eumeta variegata TaxID=151549 RepID=A0A4C1YTA6_EUMVA|nr:hypothetical protein EVAR_59916_1 [Eumeta japonica]